MADQPRYVVLRFDNGDRYDYDPPLKHPADVFLERFAESFDLNADIGATSAVEIDFLAPENWWGRPDVDDAPMIYPPTERGPIPWIDGP